MSHISLTDAVATATVTIFDTEFESLPATRSLLNKLSPMEKRVAETDDPDQMIAVFGEMLDARLRATGGSRKKPSVLIKEKWQAEQLTLPALQGFVEDLNAAQFARPT